MALNTSSSGPPSDGASREENRRQARKITAVIMLGFGGPQLMLAAYLLRIIFMPGRGGSALVAFRFDHPLAIIMMVMAVTGGALCGGGWLLLRNSRLPSDS